MRNQKILWMLRVDKENVYGTMHQRMTEVLSCFGFPPRFILFVKKLYEDIFAQIITGRGLSQFFQILAGAIQGDPLSCLLFVICNSELMIHALLASGQGYCSHTLPTTGIIPITAYCDDDDIYASDFDDLVKMFNIYKPIIDWLLNRICGNKCEILLICPTKKHKELLQKVFTIDNHVVKIVSHHQDSKALGFPISSWLLS